MTHNQLLKHFGSIPAAAKALGVTRGAIYFWKTRGIPLMQQVRIEAATKGELRADLPAYFRKQAESVSLDLKPVQVRLPEDAYAALSLLAQAQDKDLGEVARELLTRILLGEAHAIKVTAERLARAIASESKR